MNAEPWLCLGDVELGSAQRTLTYLRRGLGGPLWTVHTRSPLLHEGGGYSDIYSDIYSRDPFSPENLACYCPALDGGPYVSPATDDAPWYSADLPDSAGFLGFVPWAVEVRPTLARASAHGYRGAVLGPQDAGGQIAVVTGAIYGTSRASMRHGERWLRDLLADDLCDTDRALRFLGSCPDEEEADFRSLPTVGLVDGPVFGPIDNGVKDCLVQSASFQLLSESPFALGEPELLIGGATVASGATVRRLATLGEVGGDAALRLVVEIGTSTGDPMTDLHLAGYPTAGGACPSLVTSPAWEFTAPSVDAGLVVTVDASIELAEVRNPSTDEVVAGLDAFDYDAPFPWPTLVQCSEICVELTAGDMPLGTIVTLSQIRRGL